MFDNKKIEEAIETAVIAVGRVNELETKVEKLEQANQRLGNILQELLLTTGYELVEVPKKVIPAQTIPAHVLLKKKRK